MKPIKTEDLKEFISSKREEWTVFASGPTKPLNKAFNKSISFNLDKNEVMVEANSFIVTWQKTFTSVTAAVEYFNNEEW